MKKIISLFILIVIIFISGCNNQTPPEPVEHQHTFYENYTYDSNFHWQEASCGHSEVTNKTLHEFDEGTIYPATFEEDGYIIYKCKVCNAEKEEILEKLIHTYSEEYSYDDTYHFHVCLDQGYEHLKKDEELHTATDMKVVTPATPEEPGIAEYTCSECGHKYQKEYIEAGIIELPTITNPVIYIGQTLSSIKLTGGKTNIEGTFNWTNPNEVITTSGKYSISFIPKDLDRYATIQGELEITATQLYVNVNVGENGTSDYQDDVKVNYGSNLIINFSPNDGYQVKEVIVDGENQGIRTNYKLENIKENHTISVTFEERPTLDGKTFMIEYVSGTGNAYSIDGNTITFTQVKEDTVYSISGTIDGNIIIDIGDDYKFDLELLGLTLSSNQTNPILILSGNEVSITAKKGYENTIIDNRTAIDETDETLYSATIHSLVDLEIKGKGSLTITSENNNGIHSKKDLQVKNLNLEITCVDNCLKGNDSVEVTNATTTLISTKGDTIKTTNSDISDKGNQRGTIFISGGVHNLYAACDGLDAAYNVLIDDETTELNIYTDKYSSYSEEITETESGTYYVRYSSNAYKFSVKYYNSESDYLWVNPVYHTSVFGGRNTYYYYKFDKLPNYSKLIVYVYSSTQTQGQETSYYATSGALSLHSSYDTIAFTTRGGSLKTEWMAFSSSQGGFPGGPGGPGGGGMQEGNSDKGTYSTKGIKASNEIIINNGKIYIKSYDDALHANKDVALENNETPLGNVTINGGNITIYTNDDGLHADGTLCINDGIINVTNAYEGAEGSYVIINGGNLSIISSDDGINATATTGTAISITGGNVYVYAKGDGLDSNSTTSYQGIIFKGGNTVVISNSNGNAAIDSERGYSYTGGNVVVLGSSGGMSSENTNCSNFSSIATKTNLTVTNGYYLNVKVNSTTKCVVKIPVGFSALAIYLGSTSATFTQSQTTSETLDTNGVCWK